MFFLLTVHFLFSQRVHPLVSGLTVDSVLSLKPNATKIARDAVSGHLFYATGNGDIYEVFTPVSGTASDVLRYTVSDHGITGLQGLYFRDSVLYLCGTNWASTTGIGKVMKGTLKPNGSRTWVSVAVTDPYPTANSYGDHGFAGVNLDPAGNFIYVSSGARTHLGEIRTNGGAWPNKREVPLTTRIFRFPVNAVGVVLPNDSLLLDNSGYVFAWGTRNAYDMAWDGNNNLFAIDNSGERDDPEELNWLQQGKHYGYPWKMGGNYNPLMNSPYNVNNDPLVNHQSSGYQSGWFADVPGFPTIPAGVMFTEPVRNYGNDADFFKDSVTGKVKNAGDLGTYITSFTSHRSPLGLSFDADSVLDAPYKGTAFVLSFMPGGDSTGASPLSPWGGPCPFVDPARDLLQLKLGYSAAINNYTMTTHRLVDGFYLPVDADLTGNEMYVIENGGDLWRITFPMTVGIREIEAGGVMNIYPNPTQNTVAFDLDLKAAGILKISVTDIQGKEALIPYEKNVQAGHQKLVLDMSALSPGIYFYKIDAGTFSSVGKLSKIN
ncbi:MAG: T9SS type A sorting domain-containing protein [Bacteroidota bacterium]